MLQPSIAHNGLSTGQKVGIGVGIAIFTILVIVLAALILWRRWKSSGAANSQVNSEHKRDPVAELEEGRTCKIGEIEPNWRRRGELAGMV